MEASGSPQPTTAGPSPWYGRAAGDPQETKTTEDDGTLQVDDPLGPYAVAVHSQLAGSASPSQYHVDDGTRTKSPAHVADDVQALTYAHQVTPDLCHDANGVTASSTTSSGPATVALAKARLRAPAAASTAAVADACCVEPTACASISLRDDGGVRRRWTRGSSGFFDQGILIRSP